MPIDQLGQIMRMDQAIAAGVFFFGDLFERRFAMLEAVAQEGVLLARMQPREQGLDGVLDVSHYADIDRMTSAQMGGVAVDLDELGLVRIELASVEIGAE